jgi:hypothetical protein
MYEQAVSVTWLGEGDDWHAVFMKDADGDHEMFEGTRDQAIAWGLERCANVKVYVPGESRWEVVRAAA